ncbi:MAG: right-handed parallel beta-helix repeat-containing protein [Candidatus Hydrogenedentes bacterium]|nr:right-handed parallel beta-helix repeat-containing protein [Candidatus Hydrogenedentota bacterium]
MSSCFYRLHKIVLLALVASLAWVNPAQAATIAVTTNASYGVGSLFAAIVQSNGNGQPDTIVFPASFILSQTITLPAITENGTTIDGSGSTLVSIDGNGKEMFATSLVNDFTLRNIQIANSLYGVHIIGGQNNQVLNCTVSSSTWPLYIQGNATTSQVRGCTISNNTNGMFIVNSNNSTVGGTTAAERNRISANNSHGLTIQGTSALNNVIIGNWFGLNVLGTLAEANIGNGIRITGGRNNIIGGTTSAERNVISGNFVNGIQIDNANASGNVIIGNYIGTDRFGSAPVPNTVAGVSITSGSHDNRVGGTSLGEFNLIRYNIFGVAVNGSTTLRNQIRQNAIFDNTTSGISLTNSGNTNLAAPVFQQAAPLSGTVVANGTVDIYIDDNGQGEIWVDSVSSIAGVFFSAFDMSVFEGEYATATLTDSLGNTSPFSTPFLIDVTPPTGTIDVVETLTINPVVSLDLTVADNLASEPQMSMRFSNTNGASWSAWEPFAATKSWDLYEGLVTPEGGIRTVLVQYRDAALNTSISYSATTEIDNTPPTGTIVINGTVTNDPNVTLELTAADNYSAEAQMSMRFSNTNGSSWSDWEPFASTRVWDLNLDVALPEDGIRTVLVEFQDEGLNISDQYSASIELDTTPPSVTDFDTIDNIVSNAAEVRYTITFSEPVANIETGTTPPFDDFVVVEEAKAVSGAAVVEVEDAGANTYLITVGTGTGEGLLHLDLVDTGGLADVNGNAYVGSASAPSYVIDRLAITQSPQSGAETEEFPFTFSVQTEGGLGTLVYTWYKNGDVIPDESGPTYTINALELTDGGAYSVAVSDDYLTVTSDEAILQVIPEVPVAGPWGLAIMAIALAVLGIGARNRRTYTRMSGK